MKSMIMAAALSLGAATAHAAQVDVPTFEDLAGDPSLDYTEAGYVVTFDHIIGEPGFLHIDIALGPYSIAYYIMRQDGQAFSFLSLDVLAIGTYSQFPDTPQNDLKITGLRKDAIVAEMGGSSQNGGMTVYGDAAFKNIDKLVVEGVYTQNILDVLAVDGFTEDIHLGVDNIALAAVPLPLPIAMLGSAAVALVWAGRCRVSA